MMSQLYQYPVSGIKNRMLGTENPGEFRMTCSPAQLQQRYAKAQQTSRGLKHPQGTTASIQSTRIQQPCSPVTASWSLQTDLQKGYLLGSKPSYTPSSSSEQSNEHLGLHSIADSSVDRCCQGQQVKGSPAALEYRQTRTHNPGHSRETPSIPHPQQVSFPFTSRQLLTEGVSPLLESEICAQIEDYIAKRLADFRTVLTHSKGERNKDPTLKSESNTPNVHSATQLPTTSVTDKDVEMQTLNCAVQHTVAVGQVAEEEDPNSINAELEIGGSATSASEKDSTEYPKILRTAAATCTKNEDEGPVVLAVKPGRTREEHVKKPTSSMSCPHSSQKDKSQRVNKKKLKDPDQVCCISRSVKDMTRRKNCVAALEKVEAKGLDHVPCATEVLKGFQNKSNSLVSETKKFEPVPLNQVTSTKEIKAFKDQQHQVVTCWKDISHSEPNLSVIKLMISNVSVPTNQSQTNDAVVKDSCAVRSETDLSMALSENQVENHSILSESNGEGPLKLPVYEDITDDDLPHLATEFPHTGHEKLSLTACYEAPQYEDISDVEDKRPNSEIIAVEMSSSTQVPEPMNKQSSVGNEGYGHVQDLAQIETQIISDEELIPKEDSTETETLAIAQHGFIETDDGFEGITNPEYDSERQTNQPVCWSPSSDLNEDETDDEIDDDYLVIPISVAALKFEPEDEDQDSPEKCVSHSLPQSSVAQPSSTCPTPGPSKKQVLASAFPSLEVFETTDSFLKAKVVQFQKMKMESIANTNDADMEPPENMMESGDSCNTDDSCDYPSTTDKQSRFYQKFVKKRPEPDDTIVIDSDTEDETANCEYIAPGKQPHPLDDAYSSSFLNNGVASLVVVKPSPPNKSLTLLKVDEVHRKSTDGALPAITFKASSLKTDSYGKDKPHLKRTKKRVRFKEIPKPGRHGAVKETIQAPRMDSKQVSLPKKERPPTALGGSSPTSDQLSETSKSSASSRELSPPSDSSNSTSLPTSKHSKSVQRKHLPASKLHAHSTSSTLIQSNSPTKVGSGSAIMELSARERLTRECANNFIPLRRRKKRYSLDVEDLRTNDLSREPRPGPSQHDRAPRQRHSSQKLETPLMKKTKIDAVQWTKAINKDIQREIGCSVGEGYKWSEKPSKADYFPQHGFCRRRRKYRFSL